ncbi:hypothetical protein EPR50_G00182670 [Perca flavescens]|uniref:C2H2-type domain-containing protein n=1 Tax=Perca flavescens TaxID=8167 RepID=A0A484CI83_PERFV|nr:hypothetical protein EPR50_G00182670 [Perca flavescens]
MNPSGDSECSASSPPPQADVPDHKYARSSSQLPSGASSVGGGASATHSRKQRLVTVGTTSSPVPGQRRDEEATDGYRQCSRCEKLFPNAERLSDHERKSHPVCSVCGAAFTGHQRLREHVTTEHGLLPYGCSFCPKRFDHNAHRNLHVKTRHTGEKSCRCDLCGKAYSCVSLMKTHRLTHAEKTFICDVCGKRFFHAGHLTRHKAAHQELRRHRCNVCGKGFTQAGNLLRHQLVHRDVLPYRCTICGKGFTQAAGLCMHQASHNGERQLCSVCGKSYRCLKNHVICKHSQDLPADELPNGDAIITCELCGKKFPHLSQFRVHQRSHTGEKPFGCAACGKTYAMKQQLRDHMYTHSGEKPFRCSLCGKSFHLRASFSRHRSIHSGETPFGCSLCGKHFRLQSFLKAHLQTKAHLKQTQSATAHL